MADLEPANLLDLRARVLFLHDERDDITGLNESGGGPGPLVYVGRTTGSVVVRFAPAMVAERRASVAAFVAALSAWTPGQRQAGIITGLAAAAGLGGGSAGYRGPVYRFPPPIFPPMGAMQLYPAHASLLHPELATLGPELARRRPTFAVIRGGQAVSVCYSARAGANAAEAGVETASPFRGEGCAGLAVAAWADAVRASGRVPFYSTSWENAASIAVAAKLELIEFGEDIHVG